MGCERRGWLGADDSIGWSRARRLTVVVEPYCYRLAPPGRWERNCVQDVASDPWQIMHPMDDLERRARHPDAQDAAPRRSNAWHYERRAHPLLPLDQFLLRVSAHVGVVAALVGVSVIVGLAGFMHYEHLAWRDAFLQTAMLLGGMGPTAIPQTSAGKIFAAFFALYAGLVFIVAAAILTSPAIHRLLHRFARERDTGP